MKKLFILLLLSATPLFGERITVTIKQLVTQYQVETNTHDRVVELKREIERLQGIQVGLQRLIFNGHELHDCSTLEEENIQEGSLINLALRLRPVDVPCCGSR